jgi:hypothetical protein
MTTENTKPSPVLSDRTVLVTTPAKVPMPQVEPPKQPSANGQPAKAAKPS